VIVGRSTRNRNWCGASSEVEHTYHTMEEIAARLRAATVVAMAVAMIGPMPGMLASR
jgi:hypothetical protein